MEFKTFHHRCYIPFNKIDSVSIEKLVFGNRLHVKTKIGGAPKFITLPNKQLSDLATIIQNSIGYNKATPEEAIKRAAD